MVEGLNFSDSRMDNVRSLYNAAPRLIGARIRLALGLRASQGFLPSLHCLRGARGKQPYVIAMKDGSPFGLAGLWRTGESRRQVDGSAALPSSRCLPTICWAKSNRMAAIREPASYDRWVSNLTRAIFSSLIRPGLAEVAKELRRVVNGL